MYNRKCIVCGKEYEFCNTCRHNTADEMWKVLFHDENCKTVHEILSAYHVNGTPVDETYEKLHQCDLTVGFTDSIQKSIDEISSAYDETHGEVKKETKVEPETTKETQENKSKKKWFAN